MKWVIQSLSLGALTLSTGGVALAQQAPAYPPAYEAPPAVEQAPAPVPVVQAAPQAGEWINTAEYGWIWVPASSTTVAYGEVPYTYLYTPAYGWTWYASPWGWGPYHRGEWVSRPWGRATYWHGGGPRGVVRGAPVVHVGGEVHAGVGAHGGGGAHASFGGHGGGGGHAGGRR